jgi:cytochrome d ubiquinol oxidase subunit II
MQITMYLMLLMGLGLYVVMDGFDLGIGTLSLFEKDQRRRFEMLEHVATVWDANESWILLIAMGMWAAFPAAYGAILPALYVPLVIMLIAFIIRGFGTELISQHGRYHRRWGAAWGIASLVAGFVQGTVIGGVLAGLTLHGDTFSGGPFSFLHSGYAVLTGVATVALYMLAGAAWLYYKERGEAKARAGRQGRMLVGVTAVLAIACALLAPFATSAHLTWQPAKIAVLAWTVLLAAAGLATAYAGFRSQSRLLPFAGIATAIVSGIAGTAAMFFPLIAAPSMSLYRTAAAPSTLIFMLVALGVIMPVTLGYNIYGYTVFHDRPHPAGAGSASATPSLPGKEPADTGRPTAAPSSSGA